MKRFRGHIRFLSIIIVACISCGVYAQTTSDYRCPVDAIHAQLNPTNDSILITWQSGAHHYELKYKNESTNQEYVLSNYSVGSDTIIPRFPDDGIYSISIRSHCYVTGILGRVTEYVSNWKTAPETIKNIQVSGCINYVDFNSPDVMCFKGVFSNPYRDTMVVDNGYASQYSCHTVHYIQGERDTRTGANDANRLKTIPDGEQYSVRLGNWHYAGTSAAEADAEAIAYKMHLNAGARTILVLKYAVVLQDPSHTSDKQPRFTLDILDSEGNQIDPTCGYFDFFADATAPGWNTYVTGSRTIVWKDWTTIGVDLSPYAAAGETDIYIRLTTRDCQPKAHYGYAYFTLACQEAVIEGISCQQDVSQTLKAPYGFKYEWYKQGNMSTIVSTSRELTVSPSDFATYLCKVISLENDNCFFWMTANLNPKYPKADFEYNVTVENCQNKVQFTNKSAVYNKNGVEIDPPESYYWDFGAYGTSTEKDPEIIVPATGGNINVKLNCYLNGGYCDHDTTINVVINRLEAIRDTIEATICEGATYEFEGTTYNSTGYYSHQFTSHQGCDSVRVLHLTVLERVIEHIYDTICAGQTYMFNGTACTTNGTYGYYTTSSYGCDSTARLHLYVHQPVYGHVYDSICHGESYTFNGQTYNTAGEYSHSGLTSAKTGCDSIAVLHLYIYPNYTYSESKTICEGESYLFEGVYHTIGGTYKYPLQTTATKVACDSSRTLILTVKPKRYYEFSETVCYGGSVTVGTGAYARTYNTTGDHVTTLRAANGCDSVVTLHLTVRNRVQTTLNETVCYGGSVMMGGESYSVAGTYTKVLTDKNGCDSTVTLNLTVRDKVETTLNETVCYGGSYKVGNNTYNTAGQHITLLTNKNGCDSTVILNLTIRDKVETTLSETICYGGSYKVGNKTYNTSGQHITILKDKNNCDSTVILNLTVRDKVETILNETVCYGGSYKVGNNTYNTSGQHITVLTDKNGCDSTVILNLTVRDKVETTLNETVCYGQTYTVGEGESAETFRNSGVYPVFLTDKNGCDSIVTLNLVVRGRVQTTLNETVCYGGSYKVGDNSYTTSGQHITLLTDKNGCDSTVTLNLTIRDKVETTLNETVCYGESYRVGNNTYNTSGQHITILKDRNNCDSTVILNLTVRDKVETTLTEKICFGESYTIGSGASAKTYKKSGTYTVVLTDKNGCDSTITLNLTVRPKIESYISQTICYGQSITIGSGDLAKTYSKTGEHTTTLRSKDGCDSIVHLDLTVRPKIESFISQSICEGESVTVGSGDLAQTYSTTGEHITYLVSKHGCDSIVHLDLTVNTAQHSELNVDLCPGEGYSYNGRNYYSAGSYQVKFASAAANGCDSIVTLNIAVHTPEVGYIYDTICYEGRYFFNGAYIKKHGEHRTIVKTQYGCDSTVVLYLYVKEQILTEINEVICQGESYNFYGVDYNATGIYEQIEQAACGCDSTVRLNLTVAPKYEIHLYDTICYGETFYFGGQQYAQSGDYVSNLTSWYGCDSIVYEHLTVRDQIRATLNETICEGERYYFSADGKYYNLAGEYQAVVQSVTGCDSTVTLNLTILENKLADYYQTICYGDEYLFNGTKYSESGVYQYTLTASNGCDSVEVLYLTVRDEIRFNYTTTDEENGANTGSITLDVGLQDWSYSVDGVMSGSLEGLASAHYIVIVYDNSTGCASAPVDIFVDKICITAEIGDIGDLCADDGQATISIEVLQGIYQTYSIDFDDAANAQGFVDISDERPTDDKITVYFPTTIRPDRYTAKIYLKNGFCDEHIIDAVFDVRYASSIMEQKWNNVIALHNSRYNGGYEWDEYQWYCNGQKLIGEIGSYLYLGKYKQFVDGDHYCVELRRTGEGYTWFSCDLITTMKEDETEYLVPIVTNRIVSNLPKFNQTGTAYWYYTSGQLVQTTNVDENTTTLTAPHQRGVYILDIKCGPQSYLYKVVLK